MADAGGASGCGCATRTGHRTTTLVTGLRMTGMVARMVLDGPINDDWLRPMYDRSSNPTSGAATWSS
jgi:hypothetical protein